MNNSAQQVSEFVDPYNYEYYDHISPATRSGWTFDSGLPDMFSGLIGLNQNARVENERLRADQLYERANIESARAWSEYMDNTAVQRRVKDIEAAGLNPWLAVQNGLSASGGSGSQDTGGSAKHKTDSKQSESGLASLVMALIKYIVGS